MGFIIHHNRDLNGHFLGTFPMLLECPNQVINMPGETGLSFARYVTTEYQNTAVIMVTVIEDQKTAWSLLDMGVYGYVIKPFDENQILISAANALRRRDLEIKQREYQENLESLIDKRTADILNANKALQEREVELSFQKNELEEVNSALRVLLKYREEDKALLEENVMTNIKMSVEPFLDKIKRGQLTQDQRETLQILELNINDLTTHFIRKLSSTYLNLTPTEIHVSGLIKQGKTSKEIAMILNISENTVMTHRYKTRQKLGLLGKKNNLYSYLQTLQ
jgi:DNA-binding NarL/FixJ family response regulator